MNSGRSIDVMTVETVDQVVWARGKTEESSCYREPLTEVSWNQAMSTVRRGLDAIAPQRVHSLIARIDCSIAWLDPVMTRYCGLTCPACADPCCNGKRIFFNLADLLVLTARSTNLPPGQTRAREDQPCRYLTPQGCTLARTHRPYVCVWFLCAPQMELLEQEGARFQREFSRALAEIRTARLGLEALFEEARGTATLARRVE